MKELLSQLVYELASLKKEVSELRDTVVTHKEHKEIEKSLEIISVQVAKNTVKNRKLLFYVPEYPPRTPEVAAARRDRM